MFYENTNNLYENPGYPFISTIFRETYSSENHCHKALEIVRVIRGTVSLMYDQQAHTLIEGDIFIIPPFANHACAVQDESSRQHTMIFDMDIINPVNNRNTIVYENVFSGLGTYSRHWDAPVRDAIMAIMEKLHAEYTGKAPLWQMAIQALANELLVTALRGLPPKENIEINRQIIKLKDCVDYISKNLCYNISAKDCAAAIGLSPSHFSVFFKRYMGETFQDYMRRTRIEKARFLLISTDLPVIDVCHQSGYSDIRTFDRVFKQETGLSPSAYRKEHTKK